MATASAWTQPGTLAQVRAVLRAATVAQDPLPLVYAALVLLDAQDGAQRAQGPQDGVRAAQGM